MFDVFITIQFTLCADAAIFLYLKTNGSIFFLKTSLVKKIKLPLSLVKQCLVVIRHEY